MLCRYCTAAPFHSRGCGITPRALAAGPWGALGARPAAVVGLPLLGGQLPPLGCVALVLGGSWVCVWVTGLLGEVLPAQLVAPVSWNGV